MMPYTRVCRAEAAQRPERRSLSVPSTPHGCACQQRAPRARHGRRTDGAVAGRVDLARQVQRVRGRQVRVGRRDRQDDGVVALPARRSPLVVARSSSTVSLRLQGAAEGPAGGRAAHLSHMHSHARRDTSPIRLPSDGRATLAADLAVAARARCGRAAGALRARRALMYERAMSSSSRTMLFGCPSMGTLVRPARPAGPLARRAAWRQQSRHRSTPRSTAACRPWTGKAQRGGK